jgi:excisionase family DNA binding protein
MKSNEDPRSNISPAYSANRADEAGSAPISPRAFSVGVFCRRYGIGRTNAYQEIAARRLRAVKVGRRTLITQDAAEAWLAALPELSSPTRTSNDRRETQS